jgi:hypothetical protein
MEKQNGETERRNSNLSELVCSNGFVRHDKTKSPFPTYPFLPG